ncbi:MAG: choice-of-anchor tandem repeat NxxGxxAF-containing protein [Planctomycetota bacterium]
MTNRYCSRAGGSSLALAVCLGVTPAVLSQEFRTVALTGEQAPGAAPGVVFKDFTSEPLLNNSGQTAFFGDLTGPGVDGSNDEGIYRESMGVLSEVVRAGSQAPGADPGVAFLGFSDPWGHESGQATFRGVLVGPDVDGSNDEAIYRERAGVLSKVAREGSQAPGADPGVVFVGLNQPVVNASGQAAFRGFLAGPGVDSGNDIAIYREDSGVMSEVVREGNQVPGADPGVVFDAVSLPGLNASGLITFFGFLDGSGVDGSNDRGIYAAWPGGPLVEILREGDTIDVNDDPLIDDWRTVSYVSFNPGNINAFGRSTGVNDFGQISFEAHFTDGSQGVFVSNLVASLTLPGDANADGVVDLLDFDVLAQNFGSRTGNGSAEGDFNLDGTVDLLDFDILARNFGSSIPATVPEPASAAVLALACPLVTRRRRRS